MLKVGGRGDVKGKVLLSPYHHVSSSLCIVVTVYRCHCVSLSLCIVVTVCHCHHVSSSSCPCVSLSPPVLATSLSCVLVIVPCPHRIIVLGCHRPVSQQGELGRMWDRGYSPWCPRLTTMMNDDVANIIVHRLAATSLTTTWHLYSI